MKKITLNTAILFITLIIIAFTFIFPISNINYLYTHLLIYALLFFPGFILSILFTWIAKNSIPEKILKYISYLIFLPIILLVIYRLMYEYAPFLKQNFYGYKNFEEFIYYYPFTFYHSPLKLLAESLSLILLGSPIFIIISSGFLINICLKIFNIENKKGEKIISPKI